jgi:hypothetical protein
MTIRLLFPKRDTQANRNYATADDFRRLFTEDMASLYLLAFLLAGSHENAESCFVSGIEDCAENSSVFREWARSWARRVIIQNAVRMISPRPRFQEPTTHEFLSTAARCEREPNLNTTWAGVLALENFERFVFVISVLEGHDVRECAVLLGSTVLEVGRARLQALQHVADFGMTDVHAVGEFSRMAVA